MATTTTTTTTTTAAAATTTTPTTTTGTNVQRLYEISTILDNANLTLANSPQHEALFEEVLQGARGVQGAKVLSAQLIPKYLKYFQNSVEKAMNTLMDLCEEDDVPVRVNAIRALPTIAKDTPGSLIKIADILGQLLQADDRLELDSVKHALGSLIRLDVGGTLDALFNQILTGEDVLREKAILFVLEKVLPLHKEVIDKNPTVQKALSENIKKVLQDASGNEFQLLFEALRRLPIHKIETNELLDVVVDQIESNSDFKPEEQHVSCLLTCLRLTQPYYQKGITSVRIAQYLASKVFPVFTKLSEQQQSQLIKQIADLLPNASGDEAKVLLSPVYELLLQHAPLVNEAKTHFTITEAVLLMFHYLAPKAPGQLRPLCGITIMTGQPSDLAAEPALDRRKDLDQRLKLLEESTKAYVAKVRNALVVLQKDITGTKELAKKEELTQKKTTLDIALKTTQNVHALAQGLLKSEPTFLKLAPSWRTEVPKQLKKVEAPKGGGGAPAQGRRIITLNKKPTTVPTTTPTVTAAKPPPVANNGNASEKKQRPSYNIVYVPPNRQTAQQPKRKITEGGDDAVSNKKFKGRGASKF